LNRKIVIIDDDQSMCEMLETDFKKRGYDVKWFLNGKDALDYFSNEESDIVLTDLSLPGMSGIDLCEHLTGNRPDIPVVVITAFGSLDSAIAAIRAGAFDFVTKPIELDLLAIAMERALRHRELQEKINILSKELENVYREDEIIGESPAMKKLFSQLQRIADTDTSVLICGESGTGKELIAHALHKYSRRKANPFVAINCSALPETLLESELFGYKKGAFTDAKEDHQGLFIQADGGTLLLDEIGDIPLVLQPKLLRALEQRTIRPVGGKHELSFDVRIISATNRDLEAAVNEGHFREDLYYRLNVIQLNVPPLRSRGTDILLLAKYFLEQAAAHNAKKVLGLANTAAEKLLTYTWPGNVRELRNAMERAVALTSLDKITPGDLPEKVRDYQSSHVLIGSDDPEDLMSLEEVERRYISHVLKAAGGNRSMAARILRVDRKTLYRRLQQYENSSSEADD
jgi:DNA-binding NtrC family response regulator